MKTEKTIWQKSREELFQELSSTPEGLTGAEAARRLEHYGPNELQEGGRKSVLRIFLEQFADFLVIILILAAVVSAILGDVESMAVILAVITMNAILGTVQTVKATASLDSLKQMSAPTAKVVRDGPGGPAPRPGGHRGRRGGAGGRRLHLRRRPVAGVRQPEVRGERPHRRKPAGREGLGGHRRRRAAGRPQEHGVLRLLRHLRPGPVPGDIHRYAHRDGPGSPPC